MMTDKKEKPFNAYIVTAFNEQYQNWEITFAPKENEAKENEKAENIIRSD